MVGSAPVFRIFLRRSRTKNVLEGLTGFATRDTPARTAQIVRQISTDGRECCAILALMGSGYSAFVLWINMVGVQCKNGS